jgi:Tim10/DDP family zinc finger
MSDLGAQLNQLSPEQRHAIMMKAQQEANEQVMQEMMKRMTSACFERCAGTSVRQSSLLLWMRDSSCCSILVREFESFCAASQTPESSTPNTL